MKDWIAKLLGVGRVLWEYVRPIVFGETATALTRILPAAQDAVESLVDVPGTGEEKRAKALDALRAVAVGAGVTVGTAVLNLAVEMAVNKLREAGK